LEEESRCAAKSRLQWLESQQIRRGSEVGG
jgi:hypothetical protein